MGGSPGAWLGAVLVLVLAVVAGLTSPPAEGAFPGTNGRIACEGVRGDQTDAEIFAVNPDGSEETLLTSNAVRDGDPVYSPDGERVAFESQRDSMVGLPNSEIYVANNDGDLEGPDVKRLTFNAGTTVLPGPGGVLGGTGGVSGTDKSPSWSPDGSEIVFHSGRAAAFPDGTANDLEIYKMSAETGDRGGLQRLTTSKGQDAIPSWSPDGTKIAFQSLRAATATTNQNIEIFTMSPDGSDVTNISNNPGTANDPATPANENSNGLDSFPTAWSPDGRQIAFGSTRANVTAGNQNFEIYKMGRDGSNPVRLTQNLSGDTPGNSGDYDQAPAWSPDGTRIVFTSGRGSTNEADVFRAYTMNADTGEAGGLQPVANTAIFARCDWQPVGQPGPDPSPGVDPLVVCQARAAKLVRGSSGGDLLTGTAGADLIFTGGGGDRVNGLAGDDCLDLGAGADRGFGGRGADEVLGRLGGDRLLGGPGRDRFRGGPGADRISGGAGNDTALGDLGNDVVAGGSAADVLSGASGRDRLVGGGGRDRIRGGAGKDTISGAGSSDRAAGGSGNDRVSGGSGSDVLEGGAGGDVLKGGPGNDRLKGGRGRDRISGGRGKDRIDARDGQRDRVSCGRGRDLVIADRSERVSRDCERVRRRSASKREGSRRPARPRPGLATFP